MNRAITFLLLIASASSAADPADMVREAAKGWTRAAVKQDSAALHKYLAEDLQYAHAGGKTQNRDEYIATVMSGPSHYESFTFSDVNVKVYGKVSVLTGFVDVKTPGQEAYRVRTLQVYCDNNGQWQMAAHQSTRLDR